MIRRVQAEALSLVDAITTLTAEKGPDWRRCRFICKVRDRCCLWRLKRREKKIRRACYRLLGVPHNICTVLLTEVVNQNIQVNALNKTFNEATIVFLRTSYLYAKFWKLNFSILAWLDKIYSTNIYSILLDMVKIESICTDTQHSMLNIFII